MKHSIGSLMVRHMIENVYKQEQQMKPKVECTADQKQQMNTIAKNLCFGTYTLEHYTEAPHLRDNGDLVVQGYWSEDWADITFKKTEQGYIATHVKQYYRGNLSSERKVNFQIPKEMIDGRLS